MTRMTIQVLVPLLLPIVLYLMWAKFEAWRTAAAGGTPRPLSEGPWGWLIATGLVLTIAGLVAFAIWQPSLSSGQYVPPRFEDGEIKPAEVIPPE